MTQDFVSFKGIIKQNGNMNAAYVEFPFSTEELYGKKGQVQIKAVFDGKAEYRGSLANMGHGMHCLGLTQQIRKEIGKSFGDKVSVKIWEDKEERIVEIPKDVQVVFHENQEAKTLFEKMSYTHRKEYIRWIDEAKKPETRERRKIKMIEMIIEGKKRSLNHRLSNNYQNKTQMTKRTELARFSLKYFTLPALASLALPST